MGRGWGAAGVRRARWRCGRHGGCSYICEWSWGAASMWKGWCTRGCGGVGSVHARLGRCMLAPPARAGGAAASCWARVAREGRLGAASAARGELLAAEGADIDA